MAEQKKAYHIEADTFVEAAVQLIAAFKQQGGPVTGIKVEAQDGSTLALRLAPTANEEDDIPW